MTLKCQSVAAAVNPNLPLFHLDSFNRDVQTADVVLIVK